MNYGVSIVDLKGLARAMELDEQKEFATYLTLEVLAYGVANQAMADVEVVPVPTEAGEAAGSAPAEAIDDSHEALVTVTLEEFMNPEIEISAADQLAFMTEFLAACALAVPELSPEEMERLEETMADPENSGMRVVPTAHLDLKGLTSTPWDGKHATTLSLPEDGILAKIRANSGKPIKKVMMGALYGVLHKTDAGLVDHAGLEGYLLESGKGARHPETDVVWTFPVVDVAVREKPAKAKAAQVYDRIDPAVLPATGMTIRMLQGESGEPTEYDVCNASIYKLDGNGVPVSLEQVVTIHQDPRGVTKLYSHDLGGYGIPVGPTAVSGL